MPPSSRAATDAAKTTKDCWIIILLLITMGIVIFLAVTRNSGDTLCRSDDDCHDIWDRPCVQSVCMEDGKCHEKLSPGANCSSSEMCFGKGDKCDLEICGCVNHCDNVTCDSNACVEKSCNPSTGECVVDNVFPGCCLENDDCPDLEGVPCRQFICNQDNMCEPIIPNLGECFNFPDCLTGQVCNPETCGCVDLCANVTCDVNLCLIERCDPFTGQCVGAGNVIGCCTEDSQCQVPNSCYEPLCTGTCGFIFANGSMCGEDSDCFGDSFCINCECTDFPEPPCLLAEDCSNGTSCTLDICAPGGCDHIPLLNCCTEDVDCNDNDSCTTDTCQNSTGMCIFNRVDEDGDNFLCGTDCDDNNATIGGPIRFYRDADGDGRGCPTIFVTACFAPPGFVDNNLDCNDGDFGIFEGANICDFADQQVVEENYGPNDTQFFLQCGADVAIYRNVSVTMCSMYQDDNDANAVGGQIQISIRDPTFGFWIPVTNFSVTYDDNFDPQPSSVDIWEDLIVWGIERDGLGATKGGAIRIFRFDQSTLTLNLLQIIEPNVGGSIFFGSSVSIYDTTIAVGAPRFSPATGNRNGAVIVYDLVAVDTWNITQFIEETEGFAPADNLQFGRSVAIYADRLVVGAPTNPDSPTIGCYARSYLLTVGVWTPDWTFPVGGSPFITQVGFDVDVEATYTVISSVAATNGGPGEVDIFFNDGTFDANFKSPATDNAGNLDAYGTSVSLSANILIVGTPLGDGLLPFSGKVYLYFRTEGVPTISWYFGTEGWPFDFLNVQSDRYGEAVSVWEDVFFGVGSIFHAAPTSPVANVGAVYYSECFELSNCAPLPVPEVPS